MAAEPASVSSYVHVRQEGEVDFNEDSNNKQMMEKLENERKAGSSKMEKWLKSIFNWKEPAPFDAKMLTDDEYKAKAAKCLDESLMYLNAEGWKKDKTGVMEGDIVEVLNTQTYGKLFKLTGVVESPAEFLFQEFNKNLEDMPKWNPTILESKFIKKINDDIDITYQVTAGGGGGAVKPRDFVNLRMAARREGRLINCGTSIEYPGYPPTNKFVRGQNHVGCWSVEDMGSGKCTFQWLMGCNLNGWIPQYVLDVAFATAMFDFLHFLREFVEDKKKQGVL